MSPSTPIEERPLPATSGYGPALAGVALVLCGAVSVFVLPLGGGGGIAVRVLAVLVGVGLLAGLYMVQPNTAAVATLFGRYAGTDRGEGLRWAHPLLIKRPVSLRVRNLNTATLKVNDLRGNPVEIGAVVVWHVHDTAQAAFAVDDYETYVRLQAEAAVRHTATRFAYDEGDDLPAGAITLRAGDGAVAALRVELQARLAAAGVMVDEARLSHLAYAPEIAQVMLRRQQAEAIVSARHKIVQGAVGMVEAALQGLSERDLVVLDDERKAAMVSNLLVVLCSDRDTQPIVNAGTLYG